MSPVVFVVLSLVLSLAQGQWVVQGNFNSSDCQSELVDSYVQEIGACLSFSSTASTVYKLDNNGNVDRYFCQDGNCKSCSNLGQVTLNTCAAPSPLRNVKRAGLPVSVSGPAPYNYYSLSSSFPSNLVSKSEIMVIYKEEDACAGEPNSIVVTPGPCAENCFDNILLSCSVPKGLNSTNH